VAFASAGCYLRRGHPAADHPWLYLLLIRVCAAYWGVVLSSSQPPCCPLFPGSQWGSCSTQ
jgi:hypothetical protein